MAGRQRQRARQRRDRASSIGDGDGSNPADDRPIRPHPDYRSFCFLSLFRDFHFLFLVSFLLGCFCSAQNSRTETSPVKVSKRQFLRRGQGAGGGRPKVLDTCTSPRRRNHKNKLSRKEKEFGNILLSLSNLNPNLNVYF